MKAVTMLSVAALGLVAAHAAWGQGKARSEQTLEFYGRLYPEFVSIAGARPTASGETVATLAPAPTGIESVASRSEFQSSGSRLGVRGQRALPNGWRALWQLEGELYPDEGEADVAARDTFVGLASPYGTLKIGQVDTILKDYGNVLGFFGVQSGNFVQTSYVFRKIGINNSNNASFHIRARNTAQWQSTELLGGLTLGLQYASGNRDSDENVAAYGYRPRLWSLGAKYEQGPWYLSLAHEIHQDWFGGSSNLSSTYRNLDASTLPPNGNTRPQNVSARDSATQLAVVYRFGIHAVEADAIVKRYTETPDVGAPATRFTSYRNTAWLLAMESRWSEQWRSAWHVIRANAGRCTLVGSVCDTTGLQGLQMSVGGAYYFDRSTWVFALASQLRNGKSARYENLEEGRPSVGEDIRQIAIGLAYAF